MVEVNTYMHVHVTCDAIISVFYDTVFQSGTTTSPETTPSGSTPSGSISDDIPIIIGAGIAVGATILSLLTVLVVVVIFVVLKHKQSELIQFYNSIINSS